MNSTSGAPRAAPCLFCETGEHYASAIRPSQFYEYATTLVDPERQMFHDILSQIIDRGFCRRHNVNHNSTDYKYLNGAALSPPTKRDRLLYLDLFKKGYTYNELVARSTAKSVKEQVIIPICNVLARGYKLDFEKCGIPINREMEERSFRSIYSEIFQERTMPSRFSEATRSELPTWPLDIFIYAKLRGIFTRTTKLELMCHFSGDCESKNFPETMPLFCECGSCREKVEDDRRLLPLQGIVITPAQRERMEANRQKAILRKRKRNYP
jgi:hypothetical protein